MYRQTGGIILTNPNARSPNIIPLTGKWIQSKSFVVNGNWPDHFIRHKGWPEDWSWRAKIIMSERLTIGGQSFFLYFNNQKGNRTNLVLSG